MAMVGVDCGSRYRQTHSLSRLIWSWVGGRLGTINIVLDIIIIIIFFTLGINDPEGFEKKLGY